MVIKVILILPGVLVLEEQILESPRRFLIFESILIQGLIPEESEAFLQGRHDEQAEKKEAK